MLEMCPRDISDSGSRILVSDLSAEIAEARHAYRIK